MDEWFEEEAAREEVRRRHEREALAIRQRELATIRQVGPALLHQIRDHAKATVDLYTGRFHESTDRLTFMPQDDGFVLSRSTGNPSVNLSVKPHWETGTFTITYHHKATVFDEADSTEDKYTLRSDSPGAVHVVDHDGHAWDLVTFCHHLLRPVLFPHATPKQGA